jgi:hypothetical protein
MAVSVSRASITRFCTTDRRLLLAWLKFTHPIRMTDLLEPSRVYWYCRYMGSRDPSIFQPFPSYRHLRPSTMCDCFSSLQWMEKLSKQTFHMVAPSVIVYRLVPLLLF